MCSAVAAASVVLSCPLSAQAKSGGEYTVGLGVGLFAEYPSDFSARYCEEGAGGLTAFMRRSVSAMVSVEAGATVTSGVGVTTCVLPSSPAPLDGQAYSRPTLDDAIPGQSFFATNVAAVLDPLESRRVSPRFRIAGGRLWDKRLWTWVYGAGVRLRLGSNAIVLDVERWNLAYDLRRELLIFRENGADELQSVQILRQSPRPWLFRLGWERRIG